MELKQRFILVYSKEDQSKPFVGWIKDLPDAKARFQINKRIAHLELVHLGDYKRLKGNDIFELRINYGAGLRIYFGMEEINLVILLCGGNKGSQKRDIRLAQKYWEDYLERKKDKI